MKKLDARYANRGPYDIVRLPARKRGTARIVHRNEDELAKLPLCTMRNRIFGQNRASHAVFADPTTWHELYIDDLLAMTDLPVEMAQHRECFDRLRPAGRMLVGGLGIGAAVVLLAREYPAVESVVVVEKNQDVVDLVHPHLFQQIRNTKLGANLVVVTQDLFGYLWSSRDREKFDCAFYDIWSSDGEGTFHEMVLPLRRASSRVGLADHRIECWNEDIMRGQLLSALGVRAMTGPRVEPVSGKSSIWVNWSVPFFQESERRGGFGADFGRAARLYADLFGRPGGWLKKWKAAI